MNSNNFEIKSVNYRKILIKFLAGASLGLFLAAIPAGYLWGSPDGLHTIHILVAGGFIVFCGVSAAVWGTNFLNKLIAILDSASNA